jgi:hypothetical protein
MKQTIKSLSDGLLHFFFISCLLISLPDLNAQSYVLDGNVELKNQVQVNNFANVNSGITTINGNLLIGDFANKTNIDDLTPLTKILVVNGVLTVVNTDITSLKGLHKLLDVHVLVIASNDRLQDMNELSSLENIYGSLQIDANISLESLIGLEQITSIGDSLNGYFQLFNNDRLKSLDGLENLSFVENNVNFSHNDSLTDLSALTSLQVIGQSMVLKDNMLLSDLSGLDNIAYIGRSLFIENNPKLISLEHVGKTDSVHNTVKIKNNELLTDLTGMENIVYVGDALTIEANKNLASFNGLDNLSYTGGSVEIINNPEIINLTGLGSLLQVRNTLAITGNEKIQNLNGLSSSLNLGGIELFNNPKLNPCGNTLVCQALKDEKYAYFYNNAPACPDLASVRSSCGLSGLNQESYDSGQPSVFLERSIINIQFPNRIVYGSCEIIDALGRKLMVKDLYESSDFQIPLAIPYKGLVIVRIISDGQTFNKKVIVE